MSKANTDIRQAIKASGLRQWQVAHVFGLNDVNFCKKMRIELSVEDKARIYGIIAELKKVGA